MKKKNRLDIQKAATEHSEGQKEKLTRVDASKTAAGMKKFNEQNKGNLSKDELFSVDRINQKEKQEKEQEAKISREISQTSSGTVKPVNTQARGNVKKLPQEFLRALQQQIERSQEGIRQVSPRQNAQQSNEGKSDVKYDLAQEFVNIINQYNESMVKTNQQQKGQAIDELKDNVQLVFESLQDKGELSSETINDAKELAQSNIKAENKEQLDVAATTMEELEQAHSNKFEY